MFESPDLNISTTRAYFNMFGCTPEHTQRFHLTMNEILTRIFLYAVQYIFAFQCILVICMHMTNMH